MPTSRGALSDACSGCQRRAFSRLAPWPCALGPGRLAGSHRLPQLARDPMDRLVAGADCLCGGAYAIPLSQHLDDPRMLGRSDPRAPQPLPLVRPHDAEAAYRVIPFDNGAFAVEVSIPESHPVTVSAFATEADAETWIAEHRRRVQSGNEPSRWYRSSGGSGANRRGRP